MADTNPSRLGLVNATGTGVDALFLKKFAGEVLSAFEEKNIMKSMHTVRTIQNGKSAQFPVTGKATAAYHVVGDDIADTANSYLNNIKHNERVITIDELLISPVFIANLDEAKNHYDVRSIYSTEIGNALANTFDKNIIRTVVAASRAAALIDATSTPAGGSATCATATTESAVTGDELVDLLFAAAQKLDENDVPEDNRNCVLRPAAYYKLLNSTDNKLNQLSRDYNNPNGSIASGTIVEVAGIRIHKTNHIPSTDESGADTVGENNDLFSGGTNTGYGGDFAKTLGAVFHPAAAGTVKLMDLGLESEYQIQRQGHLFVAKYAMGHGILRGSNAVELLLKS